MPGGSNPGPWLAAAAQHEQAGRWAEAEAAYLQLLARWPQLTDSWYNLARLQRRAGRYDDALASYQQALDRRIARPEEVHLNRGAILSDGLHRPEAAEAELRTALALNPRYVPALLNLANLCEDLGRRDEALATYERLLEIEPQHAEALARYAGARPVAGADDPLIHRLRTALGRVGLRDEERASLGFALGRALDAVGEYDDAFDAYSLANAASRASAAPGRVLYDRAHDAQRIERLMRAFPVTASPNASPPAARSRPVAAALESPSSPRPVFICGMFRSGSTLIEQVLAAHPDVAAGGELPLLPTMARVDAAPFPESMATITPQRLEALAARYTGELAKLFPGAAIVTDKRPDNFLLIGLVKRLFPDARIIHTHREPLDNALSIWFLHLDHSMGYALDLADIGHHYTQYRRLMAHWKRLYGDDILDCDYDALVAAPRGEIARVLEFAGLGWDERCLRFHEVPRAVRTASVWQVRQPLYQGSSGRWRHYARHLAPLRASLDEFAPPPV